MSTYPPGKMRQQAIRAAIKRERKERADQEERRAAGVFPAAEALLPGHPRDEIRVKQDERLRAEHELRL